MGWFMNRFRGLKLNAASLPDTKNHNLIEVATVLITEGEGFGFL